MSQYRVLRTQRKYIRDFSILCPCSCKGLSSHQTPAIEYTRHGGFVCDDEGLQLLSGRFLVSLDDFGGFMSGIVKVFDLDLLNLSIQQGQGMIL